jgi:hypothetical protein
MSFSTYAACSGHNPGADTVELGPRIFQTAKGYLDCSTLECLLEGRETLL